MDHGGTLEWQHSDWCEQVDATMCDEQVCVRATSTSLRIPRHSKEHRFATPTA